MIAGGHAPWIDTPVQWRRTPTREKGIIGKTCSSASLCALAALSLSLGAQAQDFRLGTEFQVHSYTASFQRYPAVAASTDGDFVVAWSSNGQDGSYSGVFARRFSSAGVALASEFQVSSYTISDQSRTAVAADGDGDFVIAWGSEDQDGSAHGVFARRFSSAGVALASEFQVTSYTTSVQQLPAVAASADGKFVFAWSSDQDGSYSGVFARRFSSAGVALASEFQVNSYTISDQSRTAVAADADGDFVVAWSSYGQDGSSYGVFARRFSSSGVAVASEFQVNSYTISDQRRPAVAADADGDFVVVWQSFGQDGSVDGVFARRFLSTGSALASEFQVNSFTTEFQNVPAVAASADGDFVIAWSSYGQDGSELGILARRFTSAGAALASEFQVNSYITSSQFYPAVSASAGDFVVAWESFGQDGSEQGIFAQRFAVPITLDVDGNGTANALTDGLLALRYLFGFRGLVLLTGAVDLVACTRCNVPSIEAYLAALTLPLGAQAQGDPSGTEFQVNTHTTGYQRHPAVAADADGDFVVAWDSYGQDGSSYGVFSRRFSRAGLALASEFQVNSFTTDTQFLPAVAADSDGDFVVAWESTAQDGSLYGVFARRFSSSGSALASEFQVHSYTTNAQQNPALAVDANGDFVVAWDSYGQDGGSWGVFARRFSSAGSALASEFQVTSYTTSYQSAPAVAASADGDFLVVWQSFGQDGGSWGVFARRFSSAGSALASEFQVHSYTTAAQQYPALAVGANGDFVVAWDSYGQDGGKLGVFARRFSSAGSALASEFQVTSYTTSNQRRTAVAADSDGDFVVAWVSTAQDGSSYGVFARRFLSAGSPLASEFQVNSYTAGEQALAAVAAEVNGDFIVAWESNGQDGSNIGVFAQRFALPITLDVDGNGTTGALTDGLLALRYLFGFRGAVLLTGAVDLVGCTRCDAAAIEGYLAGLT